jgi:hypothetical protein
MDQCGAEREGQRHGQTRENEKIRDSRYNREYKRCVTEDVSVYQERESARERKMTEEDVREIRWMKEREIERGRG